jgi:hypothetical protein
MPLWESLPNVSLIVRQFLSNCENCSEVKTTNLITLACFLTAGAVRGDLSSTVAEIHESTTLVVGDSNSTIWKGRFWIDSVKTNGIVVAKYKSNRVHTLSAKIGERFSGSNEGEEFAIACQLVSIGQKTNSVKVKYLVGFE